ncbi:zinc finger protein 600-like isoform X1 [Pieris napi]|uniref:zinc finger protein 600-like isoform X1 n=1 Tax=Pieris napi TaxID=78633 RepID=UPI001FB978AA|nr:zinc finger protein 600-like isoform X1 [Pieris napi]
MVSKEVSTWMIAKDLCRCCHAEGDFFNLATPNTFKDREEIYSDMLRTCFDIEIDPVPGGLCIPTYSICSKCVVKLREAIIFKEQVLKCEEKFYELLTSSSIAVSTQIKKEPEMDSEDYNDDMDDDLDDEMDDYIDDMDNDTDTIDTDLKLEPGEHQIEVHLKRPLRSRIQKTTEVTKIKAAQEPKPKPKPKPKKPPKEKTVKNEEKKVKKEKKKEDNTERKGTKPKFSLRPGDFTYTNGTYTCTLCDTPYSAIQSLRYHIRSKHYKLPKYKCQYCDQEFMTLPPFVVHKLNDHNVDERYECTACQTKFNAPSQLRKHINGFHMLGEKYKCDSCDYETFSFETLYKHKFKHKTVKDYHCRFCKKAFLRKATLELHERIHTGDRRKVCKICGQAFVQKASLNYHMTKYHPNVNF